mgnify:FL=1
MRIGILTLPLHTNYGGILQAYALQTVLERMGHEASVITTPNKAELPVWKWPYSYPKRMIRKYILGKNEPVFFESYYNRVYPQYTLQFINKYIHFFEVGELLDLKEKDFDAFVVGSDQVWRPEYYPTRIENAYLDFAKDWDVKRMAYAASFGTSGWEYTAGQTGRCRELLRKFDVVSVREESAVELCRKFFGVNAGHVLDPTMLLDVQDYVDLVKRADVPKSKGTLLCYILDETESTTGLISRLAGETGLVPFRGNSRAEDWSAPLAERIQPPVEQWLRGFMDAEQVVTDSFHACVFSILFHKPFVVVGNKGRGLARVKSLLKMFGLEKALYSCNGNKNIDLNCIGIDWEDVNRRLQNLRKHSFDLLGKV